MESVKAVVLLATYNGASFISELMDSLLAQSHKNLLIIIRDDGSTDATPAIIQSYCVSHVETIIDISHTSFFSQQGTGRHQVMMSSELSGDSGWAVNSAKGPTKNFSLLLEYTVAHEEQLNLGHYCVLFADQDDYWYPDKIRKMLPLVCGERPALAHCDLQVVDDRLNVVADSLFLTHHVNPDHVSLNRLLVQNCVTGCATIMNSALTRLVTPIPTTALMHDNWVALMAAATGSIVFCDEPLVKYRQHHGNSVGAKFYGVNYVVKKLFNLMIGRDDRVALIAMIKQGEALLDRCGEQMTDVDRKMLCDFVQLSASMTLMARLKVIYKHSIYRYGILRNWMLLFDLLSLQSDQPSLK